jgi:hypothetical protein
MINIKNIRELGLRTGLLGEGVYFDSLLDIMKKFFKALNIPFYDDCCPDPKIPLPVGYTEEDGVVRYNPETESFVTVPASGGGENFANADLTATGDRTHDFDGNYLYIDGLSSGTLRNDNGDTTSFLEVSNGTSGAYSSKNGTSNLTYVQSNSGDILNTFSSLFATSGANFSSISANADGVIKLDQTSHLLINSSEGTAGQVITSQGTDLPPIWADAGSTDTNFANTNLTFDGNRTHNLNGFEIEIVSGNNVKFDLRQSRFNLYTELQTGANTGWVNIIGESGDDATSAKNRIVISTRSNLSLKSSEIQLQDGYIDIKPTDGLKINNVVGSVGQILTSQGDGLSPIWGTDGNFATVSSTGIGTVQHIIESGSNKLEITAESGQISSRAIHDTVTGKENGIDLRLDNAVELFSSNNLGADASSLWLNEGIYGMRMSKELEINSNPGTSGQIVTSQGTGLPAIWADAPGLSRFGFPGEDENNTTFRVYNSTDGASFAENYSDSVQPDALYLYKAFNEFSATVSSEGNKTLSVLIDKVQLAAANMVGDFSELNVNQNGTIELASNKELLINGSAGTSGQVLTSQGVDTPPIWADASGTQNLMNIVPQIASYILLDTDFDITQDTSIEMDVAIANTLDINATLLTSVPIGSKINVIQYGVGQTQITVTAGAVLLSAGGADKLANQYSAATIVKRSATEFYLFGDITI